MVKQTRTDAQRWNDILHISGGKLSGNKCTFYVGLWEHVSTGRTKINNNEFRNLKLIDREGGSISINHIPVDQHHKSLGYLQSLGNSKNSQEYQISTKVKALQQVTSTADLDYKEAEIFYRTIYKPKIQYVTQMSSISPKAAELLSQKGTLLILNKMGYSKSTPTGVLYGSEDYGGMSMLDITVEQGAKNLIYLSKNLNNHTKPGKVHKLAFRWWWYKTGTRESPFHLHNSILQYAKSLWFQSLHSFVTEYRININISVLPFNPLRQADSFIMDLAISRKYPLKILSNINQCRLYLKVLTLSEISNITGTHIAPEYYKHSIARPIMTIHDNTAYYTKPNKSVWHYWTSFLNTLVHKNTKRLHHSLGRWIVNIKEVRKKYLTYRNDLFIYHREQGGFRKIQIHTRHQEYVDELPDKVIPCIQTPTGTILPTNFQESYMTSHQTVGDSDKIQITQTNIIIVTDASVQNSDAAWAWIVATDCGNIIAQDKGKIKEQNISSFRAEAYGVCAALQSLHNTIDHNMIEWTLYCDNEAVIHRLNFIKDNPVNMEWTDSDILQSIQLVLPKRGVFKHVKGHQTLNNDSPIPVRLNIQADSLANAARHDNPKDVTLRTYMKISSDNKILFKSTEIVRHCQRICSQEYWKKRLGNETYGIVDWEIFCIVAKHFKNQASVIKLLSGITPTKSRLLRLNQSQTALCPLCNLQDEDIIHVFTCSKNKANIINNQDIIFKSLKKYGTNESTICNIITKVTNTTQTGVIPEEVQESQNRIGWSKILQGKVTTHMKVWLQQESTKPNSAKTIIKTLLITMIQQWREAWINRLNHNIYIDTKEINEETKLSNRNKLTYIYQHKEYLNSNQLIILQDHEETHQNQSAGNIDNWLNIHYQSLEKEINTKLTEISTDNLDVTIPCEADSENSD